MSETVNELAAKTGRKAAKMVIAQCGTERLCTFIREQVQEPQTLDEKRWLNTVQTLDRLERMRGSTEIEVRAFKETLVESYMTELYTRVMQGCIHDLNDAQVALAKEELTKARERQKREEYERFMTESTAENADMPVYNVEE